MLRIYLVLRMIYFKDRPHKGLVAFQDFMSVKNHPCYWDLVFMNKVKWKPLVELIPIAEAYRGLNPARGGGSLGDLGRKIVENNKALCSLDFLVLLGQAKRTGNFARKFLCQYRVDPWLDFMYGWLIGFYISITTGSISLAAEPLNLVLDFVSFCV